MDENLGAVQLASIETEMRSSYLDYAMSVIVQRALPDARDGLKPVQRRILYAMSELGMRSNSRYRKSAGVVGEVLKNFHPHSDTAVYDTLVRMAQNFNLRYPLIDGQGNFGSVDGDGAAAMRYTEVPSRRHRRRAARRYRQEHRRFQAQLRRQHAGAEGLPAASAEPADQRRSRHRRRHGDEHPAAQPERDLRRHRYLIDNPECTVEDLMEIVQGPDFPTGGTILGGGIRAAYATGRGRVVIRAKAFVEESTRGNRFQIVVTELPYQVNKADLLERIAELVKDGKIDGISDLRDESDRTGHAHDHRAEARCAADEGAEQPVQAHSHAADLRHQHAGARRRRHAAARADAQARAAGVRRRTARSSSPAAPSSSWSEARARAHILEGLKIALDNIDEIIAHDPRVADDRDGAQQPDRASTSSARSRRTAILDMRLARLAALERKKIEDELKEVLKEIKYLEGLLADPNKILGLISDDMARLKSSTATSG